jgi:glycosyltransferase involved in cell wall biosynthesis
MSSVASISAIVPVTQRTDGIVEITKDYSGVLDSIQQDFEILLIVDGDKPEIFDSLQELADTDERIRIIKFVKSFGDAAAIDAGFRYSSGKILLTLPAHYQIEPASIRTLIDSLSTCDMAVARRRSNEQITRFAAFRRRLFHWLVRISSGEKFSDLGCSARAFNRKILEEISVYGEQHIFLPLLASKQGFRVSEVEVPQATRDQPGSRSGARFYLQRVLDIFTVVFLVRFTKKPIRFFGMIGSITFVFGMAVLLYIIAQRLFFGVALADRPALLVSSLLTVLGLQIFALGLLGELIIFTHARDMKEYTIEKIVN